VSAGPTVRVCHVITQLELGGAQENTLYTVAHLRAPFRPSLVCGPGGLLDDDARRLADVPVAFVPSLVRPIRPWSDLHALARLVAILKLERPSIVHTHSSKAGILGRLAARLAGVPVVVHSIHGFGFNDRQPAALRALLIALERAAARVTTHFVAVSRANLEAGVARGLFPRERVTLIRSGVPIAEFERAARDGTRRDGGGLRAEIGVPQGAPLIGMIACLKPQKSPLTFVEVAARVAADHPEARFVLAGDGELRAPVLARAEALGLAGRFHLLGWRRDVPRVMAALDVLILTSLWEGLPRVLPEAMAAGVPVVATRVDGTADILTDGVTGLSCAPGDVEGLASRVGRLIGDPGLRRTLAHRARAVLPEFDIDAMVRAQESLYWRLLREAGHAAVAVAAKR
jgi:glycosyltransferase involved in cell wall biosynthesis